MGIIRERMLWADRYEETDIVPNGITWKSEVDEKLIAYYGDQMFVHKDWKLNSDARWVRGSITRNGLRLENVFGRRVYLRVQLTY